MSGINNKMRIKILFIEKTSNNLNLMLPCKTIIVYVKDNIKRDKRSSKLFILN